MSRVRDLADNNVVFVDGITTADITEHTNLFFTDARADARLALKMVDEDNMSSNSAAHMPTQQSVKAYVDTEVASLVDSSPGTLDTLNELASALGDDPNFATTVTNSIATKLPLAGGTMTGVIAGFESTGIDDNSNSTAVTILSDGNVGIGTSSPQGVLDLGAVSEGRSLTFSKYNNIFGSYSEGSLNLTSNYYGDTTANAYKTSSTATFGAAGIEISGTGGTSNSGLIQFFVDAAASKTADAAFVPTERMRIDSSGNVGIGGAAATASGYSKYLHVQATSTGSSLHLTDGTSGHGAADGFELLSYNGTAYVIQRENNPLLFYTNDTEKMRIDSSGNVGIGTTSPFNVNGKNLHVQASSSNARAILESSGGSGRNWTMQSATDGSLNFYDLTGSSERMRIASSGNVGIGTSSPSEKLHIKSGGNAYKMLILEAESGAGDAGILLQGQSGNQFSIQQNGNQRGLFFYDRTAGQYRIFIDPNGNVGIGTASPRNKLSLGNPHESPANTDRILNWYDAGSELHNSNIYQAIVMDSNNTSQPGQIGIALANNNMQVGSWSPAITFGGRSQAGSGDYMNGGAAIASKNFTGTNDGNFIDSELHFFTKGSHTSAERNLSSKLKITGQGTVSITNGDLGHTHFTDKQGRYLTSNGTGWTNGLDGTDPGLVVSQYHTGTEVKNLGIVLHNDTSTTSAKSPTISFGAVSASTTYNTTYAHIVGNRRGTGADTNWASGDLEFYTQPDQGYTRMPNMTVHHGGQVSGSMNGRTFGIENNNWLTFGTLYSAQSTPLHIKVLAGHNSNGGYGEFTNDTYAYNVAAGTVVTIGNTPGSSYTVQLRKIKRVGGVGFSSGDGGWEYQIARNQGYSMGVHMQVMGATSAWRWQV